MNVDIKITGDSSRFINVMWSKGNDVTTPNGEEVPYRILSKTCFYCQNLVTVVPVTIDKKICQNHMNMR